LCDSLKVPALESTENSSGIRPFKVQVVIGVSIVEAVRKQKIDIGAFPTKGSFFFLGHGLYFLSVPFLFFDLFTRYGKRQGEQDKKELLHGFLFCLKLKNECGILKFYLGRPNPIPELKV